ncbi:actinorhodin polyketide synthase bifunctional cyclase/dehydratase [Streptomyces albiflavescens]|uniref:Actinorhodin polyketide synthase bifunctional cyclase/dehydratase n=1 Tax=Streptomyces albiflavescens TaxID=1623582 RepID=A0A918DA92_9ACTN|nr:aromatase/cyclase [Streptomyces albiflavescens]GGN94101.1 actinorhodin polyketide synthase bifunctional cyclase/dehydratase [Streptomyces albiflavescens]
MSDVQHALTVAATPETVYELLADASAWPVNFHPTVHVEPLEQDESHERIQIWAVAGDQVKAWTSLRELDPEALRITFRQEVSQPPIAAMSGAWVLRGLSDGGTEVTLEHSYRAVDDAPDDLAWITEVTDRNSRTELANLKALAEQAADRSELRLTFEDRVVVDGAAGDVYDFLYQARRWPERLPHVARMDLREDEPGVQIMEMDTITADGAMHTTKSVRVCFADERIVYKQTVVPPLMTAHTGEWRVTTVRGGVAVTSRHTVAIRPEAVPGVLGEAATVADAREFARTALSGNSRITLEHAKAYAEDISAGSQV